MTRSVEIPEAAVEQACEVMHDAYERAAVVHAWETNPASRHQDWADVPEDNKATMRDAVRALLGWLGALETTPQPVGDGGLREALAKMASAHEQGGGQVSRYFAHMLNDLLAAHPAVPAVPQPVDRRELLKLFEREGVTTTRVMGELAYRQELADAVLALLAGEQEQVESPE